MKRRFRRCLTVIGLVAGVLAVAPAPAGDPTTVVVTSARPAQPRTVELPGSFEPYEDAMLYARVTGYVSAVRVDIGQRVPVGTALLQLDLPEMEPELGRARADILGAEAALEAARAQVDRDRITHERLSELQAREPLAVTQQDVDIAAADLRVAAAAARAADAEIAVARAKLGELQAMMAYATIRAPFDALVTRRMVDPGALVVAGADGGDPVLRVIREDRLRLVLAVPEQLVTETRVGLPVGITVDAIPGQAFEATITRCAGALSMDTRTMRAEIDMDYQEGLLRSGMYATVELRFGGGSDELSVPAAAIRHDGAGQAFVWTVRDGAVVRTPIQIARDDGAFAVIRAGLAPETAIVLETPAELHEGQSVQSAAVEEDDR